ncbi:protease inhibitor I42 family protein [Clostridium felsineum]|uniref:Proteinase inhibitor I42 chagasin domain-containing protein n=1 Tax=Clostridium felsineum TaxID=36839 RepID=A0A1S8M934_9CLOT|nr:protease inhibitor I42 family protein [Clostridium felsineum]MCR3760892.1 protease inhibitor I42 family protein [Clostridium felsineum]URZ04424.1 hypothetical protein CLAUR_045130 [Clostridium felsineum]URZ07367.1 hypothetical protein CLROS_027050 [Clostridium felsineum]URZ12398.1 hypothetical protein CROST_031200 [Clostridium felsineum]
MNSKDYGILLITTGINKIKLGEEVWIILDGNPSTGYNWKLDFEDSGIYRVQESFFLPSRTESVGTKGKAIWILKATDKGETVVSLNYARSFDKKPIKNVAYSIVVE